MKVTKMIYRDPAADIRARVEDLLRRMTPHEKVMQLIQGAIGSDSNPNNPVSWKEFDPLEGSVLSFSGGVAARDAYQRHAVEGTRLGIPLIWCFDVIHGYRTIYPIPLAQACAFDPAMAEAIAAASAAEARAENGVDVLFSPMCEVCRDPRWGRVMESAGEEPFLAAEYAAAAVRGVRRASPFMSACLKHFAGYSSSEGGRDYQPSEIPALAMRESYLVPFEAGVRAGARAVMSGFNLLNGVPTVAHRGLLTDILRGEWGFSGFVVSDCRAVAQLGDQGFSSDPAEQAAAALAAGNDMDMADGVYTALEAALAAGKVPEKNVDDAVRRVLRVKFELGLFEHPYAADSVSLPDDTAALTMESAVRSAVLLQNEHAVLPLAPGKRRIALVGPAADDASVMIGAWKGVAEWTGEYAATLRETVGEFYPEATVSFAAGCGFAGDDDSGFAEALRCAEHADVIIAAMGEHADMSGEYRSRARIGLPGRQLELLRALRRLGKPVILLLFSGRPLCLTEVSPLCDAMLMLWHGGTAGARAAWKLVSGQVSPSGKLAMTFPRAEGQIPIYGARRRSCRRGWRDYIDLEDGPLFPFGFGLSYTTLEYGEVTLRRHDGGFVGEVSVANTGNFPVEESVIWFISDPEASLPQPERRMIGISRLRLAPGEKATASLIIDPERDLSYPDAEGVRRLEPGKFILSASGRAECTFTL